KSGSNGHQILTYLAKYQYYRSEQPRLCPLVMLLSSRMAGDCWKMTWSDVPVVPSNERKKGCQMRQNSTPIYRQNRLYGVTKLKVYGATMTQQMQRVIVTA
ncbi:hypothetical protein Tco_1188074, partial [Tanacetum coccineum]